MSPESLRALLDSVRDGETSPDEALESLRLLPYEELGFATLDHHRALRRGFAEVVFCQGKTPAQVATIMERVPVFGSDVRTTQPGILTSPAGRFQPNRRAARSV